MSSYANWSSACYYWTKQMNGLERIAKNSPLNTHESTSRTRCSFWERYCAQIKCDDKRSLVQIVVLSGGMD